MQRVIKVAECRSKPPSWLSVLPWHQTDRQQDTQDEQDDDEQDDDVVLAPEEEEEEEDNKDGEDDPIQRDLESALDGVEMTAPEIDAVMRDAFPATQVDAETQPTVPAADDEALAAANKGNYETRFSTQLMVPLRRLKSDGKTASWEAGTLQLTDLDDDTLALATWPDGYKASLDVTVGFINGLSRGRGGTQPSKKLEWTHLVTKHSITVAQRVDRCLLVSTYEQNRQVLQVRVDAFGAIEDQSKQLPDNDPVLLKAMEFMGDIAKDFAGNVIMRHDLADERKTKLALMFPPQRATKKSAKTASKSKAKASTPDTAAPAQDVQAQTLASAQEVQDYALETPKVGRRRRRKQPESEGITELPSGSTSKPVLSKKAASDDAAAGASADQDTEPKSAEKTAAPTTKKPRVGASKKAPAPAVPAPPADDTLDLLMHLI